MSPTKRLAVFRGAATPAQLLSEQHRIPVLWSLYRPLLRLAPDDQLAAHIKRAFRRTRSIQNLAKIKANLAEGYSVRLSRLPALSSTARAELPHVRTPQILADFDRIRAGDLSTQSRFATLSAHIARSQPAPPLPARAPPKHPTLTCGVLFSTPYNPPLPRLKPQPEHISMLIFARRKAIQRRWDRFAVAVERAAEAREETAFERRLGVSEGRWGDDWDKVIVDSKKSFDWEALRNRVRSLALCEVPPNTSLRWRS